MADTLNGMPRSDATDNGHFGYHVTMRREEQGLADPRFARTGLPLLLLWLCGSLAPTLAVTPPSEPSPDDKPRVMILRHQESKTVPDTECRIQFRGYRRFPCPSGVQCVHAGTEKVYLRVKGPPDTSALLETSRIIGQSTFPFPLNALGLQLTIRRLQNFTAPLHIHLDVRRLPGIPPCGVLPRQ